MDIKVLKYGDDLWELVINHAKNFVKIEDKKDFWGRLEQIFSIDI